MSTYDPFAQADEPATNPVSEAPPKVEKPGEGKIVLTFKEGSGFDASWIVVHAESVADADAILNEQFAELMVKAKKVAAHYRGGAPSASSAPARSGGGRKDPPANAPAKPFDDFVYMSGLSKATGKPWQAWMPPEKGDSRKPLFFD